ncbi:MAG: HAMP domain-containing histidine kinase [Chloroflexi bacterium]|nr:HAMP domain-containing histidine kinase [Chloroflexota bacterium]
MSVLQQISAAERVGLVVAQSAETVYWVDHTEHPEPYWVDYHETQLFEPLMIWAEGQTSGYVPSEKVEHVPPAYGVISAIILRDQTDLAGVLLFSGEQLDIVDRENFDIAVDLMTITAMEQRTTNNLNKFLGDFAHDQRNILNIVSLSADALNEMKEMTVKSKTYLTRIFDSSLQIGNQIENALSVDRYDPETDEHHMMVEQIDLVELRREICNSYVPVAQGKRITLKMPYVRGAVTISADKGMITRAITNLVDNAFKFTPEGGNIEVLIVRGKGQVQIVVKDSGLGIAPENLDRIFERKVRIRQNKQHVRGLGLGLFIVRNVALRHNGRAWVESAPGEGSTFYLVLPVKNHNGAK